MRWVSNKHQWHRWFAWYPFTIVSQATGQEVTVWWEYVARKQVQGHYFPYYVYHPDADYNELNTSPERVKNNGET